MNKTKKLKAYICTTDFHHDFDESNADLPEFFSTLKSLKKNRTCWKECGIVQVQVSVKLLKTIKASRI